jgi:hypothetical protein
MKAPLSNNKMSNIDFNVYDAAFKVLMDELKQILGASMVLESFVTQFKTQIDNDRRIGHDLIVGSLTFRNITVNKDTPNLYLTDSYLLGRSNLDKEIEMILNRECLFNIAQSYELLETFLYDIVANLILLNGGINIFIDASSNTSDFKSIRTALKSLNDRKNNKHLIGIIRANCETFRIFEKSNIYDLDFGQWYQILGEVRHCITHNGMVINNKLKPSLAKYFTDVDTKIYLNKEFLYASPTMCRNLLSRIADFTFFCYKSVTEASYEGTVDFQTVEYLLSGLYNQ